MTDPALPPLLSSRKDTAHALALCVTLGSFGAHRYYAGRPLIGSLQLLSTLACCTLGGYYGWSAYTGRHYLAALAIVAAMMAALAIWPLMDFWLLNKGSFRDGQGLPLAAP